MTDGDAGQRAGAGGYGLLLALATAWILASAQFRYGSLLSPGPAFLPMNLGVAMAAISAWGLVKQLRASRREQSHAVVIDRSPADGHRGKVAATIVATVLFVLVLRRAGFFVSMTALMVAYLMIGSLQWYKALALGVAGTLAAWAIFELALGLPLPGSLLDNLFGL